MITASVVPDARRLDFLPSLFTPALMMRGESLAYAYMRAFCTDYDGGLWSFVELSNGGRYMHPDRVRARLVVESNGFAGEMSGDAAGIVVTLFVLGHLAAEAVECDGAAAEGLTDLYFLLRAYAAEDHSEAAAIFGAID